MGSNIMENEQIRKRLRQIIGEDTGLDSADIDPHRPIREQIALDSMQFIGLIAKVEVAFAIELPLSVLHLSTLEQFFEAVELSIDEGNNSTKHDTPCQ
jgi:acyl carrier protein